MKTEIYDIIQTDDGYEVEHTGGWEEISRRDLLAYIKETNMNLAYLTEPDNLTELDPETFLAENYREVI